MPMSGDPWSFSCSLNLASCRQRAEALARQWQTNLWSPRSSFSSDGGSRSVSPSLGFYSPAVVVVDRPPKLSEYPMSSLDDEDSPTEKTNVNIVVTPSSKMSPPQNTLETDVPANGEEYYASPKDRVSVWAPESPPESFSSESLQSDSPALTIETEERNTASSSTETISELASPTDDLLGNDKGITLADELCSRLRQFESLHVNGRPAFDHQEDLVDLEEPSCSSTLSEESTRPDPNLLSPETCPRLVRSTSLKTGKTPPDTPNRKKIVRFADALGLDLEAIRHFAEDEDARIPQSAFADLVIPAPAPPVSLPWAALPGQTGTSYQLVPQFQQPAADPRFMDRVRQQKVCLENLVVSDLRATAVVRVLNLSFEKQLFIRYTTTEWAVYTDMEADYVQHSCDGFSDKFTFILHLPHLFTGQRLAFALKYVANGQEFWDSNNGDNYVLRVQNKPHDVDAPGREARWSHLFL